MSKAGTGSCKTGTEDEAPSVVADVENITIVQDGLGVFVEFSFDAVTPSLITIHNTLGQKVVEDQAVDALSQRVAVNVPQGTSGIYVVRVDSEDGQTVTRKLFLK
ncbi:MAG: T9SS type A sorting domain-containing protein [Bacteroidota bacterium]